MNHLPKAQCHICNKIRMFGIELRFIIPNETHLALDVWATKGDTAQVGWLNHLDGFRPLT